MKNLKHKLKNYGSLAGAFLGTVSVANADIVYTNLNPDEDVQGSEFSLDINNDGTDDIKFNQFQSSGYSVGTYLYVNYYDYAFVSNVNTSNGVVASSSGMASAIPLNTIIDKKLNFVNGDGKGILLGLNATYNVLTMTSYSVLASGLSWFSYGNFKDGTNKYIGLKFKVGSEFHYGWVKVNVSSDAKNIKVIDYAYQDIAEVGIKAGDTLHTVSSAASSVVLTDVGGYGDASDIKIDFTIPGTESTTVGEYRVYLAPSADAATFNLDSAKTLPLAYCTQIDTTGSNISQTLSPNMKDINGNPIGPNIEYVAFVMSVPNVSNTREAVLSAVSDSITLDIASASRATNIEISDNSDKGDGRDLRLQFDTASYQASVAEYKVIVVKSASAASFTIDSANTAITNTFFTSIPKSNTSNIDTIFTSTSVDSDGDTLAMDVPYKVFIFSEADGVNVTVSSLSDASNEATLKLYNPASTNPLTAYDFGENGNGLDLVYSGRPASNETGLKEYGLVVVKSSKANSFTLTNAETAIAAGNYKVEAKGQTAFNFESFTATSKDTDGDLIKENVPYKLFVVSIADTNVFALNSMSGASNEVTLGKAYAPIATDVVAKDSTNKRNGLDLAVTFVSPQYENFDVSEYHMIAVKALKAGSFDLTDAATAITDGNSKMVELVGADFTAKTALFDVISTDADGDVIKENVPYNVFVVSIAEGTYVSLDNMSEMSNMVTLTSPAGIQTWENRNIQITVSNKIININSDELVSAKLLDLKGRELTNSSFVGQGKLDANQFESGVYLVMLTDSEGRIYTKKISIN